MLLLNAPACWKFFPNFFS